MTRRGRKAPPSTTTIAMNRNLSQAQRLADRLVAAAALGLERHAHAQRLLRDFRAGLEAYDRAVSETEARHCDAIAFETEAIALERDRYQPIPFPQVQVSNETVSQQMRPQS